jgi:N-acetylneuraminic acid mutarotase
VWARCVEPVAGKLDGKEYAEVRHYPTLVIDVAPADTSPAPSAAAKSDIPRVTALPRIDATMFPKLPEATSSFGGVALDGYLYVYGGHIAPTHHYDKLAVSGRFNRLKLDGGTAWEPLAGGPALQGMNLAAHGGKIYRVGGMRPLNDPGEPEDTHLVADVARFDPAHGTWEALPPLPEPRSSHDIVFVGDKLYVLGGWNTKGAGGGKAWSSHATVLDLSSANPTWSRLAQPFARRALIAAVHQGKIYVIGGFDENDDPSLKVSVFDPVTEVWSNGPDLPGKARNGFAPAACVLGGRLYASVMDGSLLRLDDKASRWELVARTTPRIVHRLIPHGDTILVVGGANHGGNFDLIEAVKPGTIAPAAESSAR